MAARVSVARTNTLELHPLSGSFFFTRQGARTKHQLRKPGASDRETVGLHLHISFPQGCVGHRDRFGQTNLCSHSHILIRVEFVCSFSPMFSLARQRKFSKGSYSILRSASMKRPCAHSRKPIRNLVLF